MSLNNKLTIDLPYTWLLLNDDSALKEFKGSIVSYGSFPCNWNGGRPFALDAQNIYVGPSTDDTLLNRANNIDQLESIGREIVPQIVKSLNDKDIPFYATLTSIKPERNGLIDDKLLEFLDFLAKGHEDNGVVVAHPVIYQAIRDRFGTALNYIASVTRFNLLPGDLEKNDFDMFDDNLLYKEFDNVILKPEHVVQYLEPGFHIKGQNPVDGISEERKDKSIILVNHSCQTDCAFQREHYLDMTGDSGPAQTYRNQCERGRDLLITNERFEELEKRGFSNFKIGRTVFYLHETLELFPSLASVIPWEKALIPESETPPIIIYAK